MPNLQWIYFFEQQTGLMNSSTSSESLRLIDAVKTFVHSGAFVTTGCFTYVIVVTVLGSPGLRQSARYILLCQHCICITGFNASGAALHALRTLHRPTARLVCWILFDLQVVMARGLTMTLTLMCMCTCLSICQPLRYEALVCRYFSCVMLAVWLLALFNPVVFTTLAFVGQSWEHVVGPDPECSTALESTGCIITALLLLLTMALLILGSYVLIYLEGHRAGHFSQSNSRGRYTILIHSLQMSLHILPAIAIVSRLLQTQVVALLTFLVFSVAQSLSPVVYGLRCRELRAELPRFVPRCPGSTSNTDNGRSDTSTGTSASPGMTTSTSESAPITDSECEEKDKLEFDSCRSKPHHTMSRRHEATVVHLGEQRSQQLHGYTIDY